MLKLTKRIEYGLIALKHMSNSMNLKSIHSAKEISERYSLPKETLAKILQLMVRFNYIHAVKGANGGYYIDDSIKSVNLMDFIEKIEGPIGLSDCNINSECNLIDQCNIKQPIQSINNNVKELFKNTPLTDLFN